MSNSLQSFNKVGGKFVPAIYVEDNDDYQRNQWFLSMVQFNNTYIF